MLDCYRLCLAVVIKQQFGQLALRGGREGAEQLAACLDLGTALQCVGMGLEALRSSETEVMTLEDFNSFVVG
jgi:hypothetical protein